MLTAMYSMDAGFKLSNQKFQSVQGFAKDSLTEATHDGRLFMVDDKKLGNIKNGRNRF